MDSKIFSMIFIIMSTVLRVSVAMPVNEIQGGGGGGNEKLPMEYKTQVNPGVINWSGLFPSVKMTTFRPIDMVKVMTDKLTHGAKDKSESYWFKKTITAGTKILQKFEQWKLRYPNTLGVPLSLVLRFF